MSTNTISRATRKHIFDGIRLSEVSWNGALDEPTFLGRLYDLATLPSFDSRYKDAAGDIYQHRVNNWDWDDDWIFEDRRFRLLDCDDSAFLAFLCEMLHPVVRPDADEAAALASDINDQLVGDGWRLEPSKRIGGRPTYGAKAAGSFGERAVTRAKAVAEVLDAAWMRGEIARLERASDDDPALAIGTAKELVETCCKTILGERGVEFSAKSDLPQLTKLLAKELKLLPEDVDQHRRGGNAVRLILQNLSSLTQYIAELRGLYGTGHGRDGKHRGLQPRHARLAVGAAVTFIDFMVATHREQSSR